MGSNAQCGLYFTQCGMVQVAADLSEGQVAAVGIMVAEMFNERNAEKCMSLDQVTARATRQGLAISADRIDKVSHPRNTHTLSHTQSVTCLSQKGCRALCIAVKRHRGQLKAASSETPARMLAGLP